MQKTTIYLEGKELGALKALALQMPGRSCAMLIRDAIKEYLRKRKGTPNFKFLCKHLRHRPHKTSFGEPVAYQRNSRAEWQ